MEILKIAPMAEKEWERLSAFLDEHLFSLHQCHLRYSYHFDEASGLRKLICTYSSEYCSENDIRDLFIHTIARAIADYYIEVHEEQCLKHIIKKDFGFADPDEVNQIYFYCYTTLFLNDLHQRDEKRIANRKHLLYEQLAQDLFDNPFFDCMGYYRFRLQQYQYQLYQVVEYAIDEHIIEQDYQEFISLLQFFLMKQSSKVDFLHVYHLEDRQFMLMDEYEREVTQEELIESFEHWNGTTHQMNEMIVTSLISLAPKQIILHTTFEQHPVILTLLHIFEHRIEICRGCRHCEEWKANREQLIQQNKT